MTTRFLVHVRAAACLSLAFACAPAFAHAQQTASPSTSSAPAPAVDPKAHEAAERFVDLVHVKEKMQAGLDANLDDGVKAMQQQNPNIRQEFLDEWHKRMKERLKLDDIVAIVVHAYETRFTAAELDQLCDVVKARNEGKPLQISDELKAKVQSTAVDIQAEIMGATTRMGAKLGGEIGTEIAKEHPDWAPPPPPADTQGK